MTKKKPAKRIEPYRTKRFGIKNHLGSIWTPETFQTQERAQKYLDDQIASWPRGGNGLCRHRVVAVRVTVSAIG